MIRKLQNAKKKNFKLNNRYKKIKMYQMYKLKFKQLNN